MKKFFSCCSLFICYLCCASLLHATPIFSIGEDGDRTWQQAINDGNVQAATDLTFAAMQFYDTQLVPYELVVPQLYTNDNVEGHEALVMNWQGDNPNPETLNVAAWDYIYDVDPDLSNAMIHFSIFAPAGIWDLSLELIDSSGNSAGWFLPMPTTGVWMNFWLKAYQLSNQQGWQFFQSAGFDLTQVVAIRLNESAQVSAPFPPPPAGGSLAQWNAWNHLRVTVPEPATTVMMGLALCMLIWRRHRAVW